MKEQKRKLPGIGMRIIKSAVAVGLCFFANYLRHGAGILFYTQIAAIWCMQDYIEESRQKALQRAIGTVIGAVFGLIALLILLHFPFETSADAFISAAIITGFIILVLYATVVLDKKQASFFSCVVFLSIVVNHLSDVNPYLFVWNRFLDTMIGLVIGMAVNYFHLPKKRNTDILFLSGMDDTLLHEEGQLSAYSKVELNRMLDNGLQFTISTRRTPAALMDPLKGIRLKLPVIAMDGAVLYDMHTHRYLYKYVISPSGSRQIRDFLENRKMPYFANVIIDDVLLIYYQDTDLRIYNHAQSVFRKSPYRNYIKRPLPEEEAVVYFFVIDSEERILALYFDLCEQGMDSRWKIVMMPSIRFEGYYEIRIYNKNATREHQIDYLKRECGIEKIVSFGSIPGMYTHQITSGDSNGVVKTIKKEFEVMPWKK